MNKLVKGFVIAAAVLIALGLVFCAGGAAAGGVISANDAVRSVLKDRDYHLKIDDEGVQIIAEKDDYEYMGTKEGTFPAEDVKCLDIEVGNAALEITEKEDSEFFQVYSDGGSFDISVKRGVLKIYSSSTLNENKVYVEIPVGFEFDEVDISAGGAAVDISYISARSLDVEIGAGAVNIGEVFADEADFEVGAGQMIVSGGNVKNCSIEVGVGELLYDGIITEKCDVECDLGNVELRLDGSEPDYNYEIECGAGSVTIDDQEYSGIAYENHINNNASAVMDIECSMGAVTVEFNGGSYDSRNDNVQHHEEQHHNEF